MTETHYASDMRTSRERLGLSSDAPKSWSEVHAAEILAYQTIAQRQISQDTMAWQTPALALTAQAFLLTLAFTPAVSPWARLLTAIVSAFVAIMSMQLMAKHVYLSQIDQQMMSELENRLGLVGVAERTWAPRTRAKRSRETPNWGWFKSRRSYPIWITGMWIFFAASVFGIVLVLFPQIDSLGKLWHLFGMHP
jgi:hypothetical protein